MKRRKRRVFGRRRVKMDGITYVLEMRKDGVYTRELHSRRERSMSLGEIVDVLFGQNLIRLPK